MIKATMSGRAGRWLGRQVNGTLRRAGLKVVWEASQFVDLREIVNDPIDGFYHAEARSFLVDVPLEHCRNLHTAAFPCTTASGNPFISTLLEYQSQAIGGYSDSALRSLHDQWQPANAAEALGLASETAHPDLVSSSPLGWILPWIAGTPREFAALWFELITADYREHGFRLDASHGWKVWGPVSDDVGRVEFSRLVRAYESIKLKGYMRNTRSDGDITGTVLSRGSESRVMINMGQHRISALSALGYHTAPVRIHSPLVRCSEVENWPNVRSGLFTVDQALDIFDRIYEGRQPFTAAKPVRESNRTIEASLFPSSS